MSSWSPPPSAAWRGCTTSCGATACIRRPRTSARSSRSHHEHPPHEGSKRRRESTRAHPPRGRVEPAGRHASGDNGEAHRNDHLAAPDPAEGGEVGGGPKGKTARENASELG